MKTGTHLNSSQVVPAHALPSRPTLRVRTGQADTLPQLSFKALFADIKPGAFEEMSKKALALRDEQARIEQARRRQKPREQDQFQAPSPEPQRHAPASGPERSTSPVERARGTSPAREAVRTPERTETRTMAERTATGEPKAPAGADRDAAGTSHADRAARADQQTGSGTTTDARTPKTADGSQATATHRPAGGGSPEAAGTDTADNPATTDLPQAVKDALAYIEEDHARQRALAGDGQSGPEQPSVPQGTARTADVAAEAVTVDVQTLAEPASTADAPRQMAQAATAGTDKPALPTSEMAGEVADADMPQALSPLTGGMENSGNPSGQGRHRHPAHPAVNLAQTASTGASAATSATQAGAPVTAAAAQAQTTPSAPPASSENFSLSMVNGAGRADAPSVGVALPVQTGHSPTRADGSPLLSSRIDAGIQTQEFREQFARQVAGLTVQGQDRAEIRLTPAELGPIRIRVSLSADDAQLDISAAQASTRAAIEASMSTLRQMLSEQGIRLAEYRMDNGQNPAFAQNRQSGQDLSSNPQQNGTAFGQGSGTEQPGGDGASGRSTGRGSAAAGSGSVADSGRTGGSARSRVATGNGRVDLFA